MAIEKEINSLPGLLAVKMIPPTDSHTSPPPSLTSEGNYELKPNTADLRATTTYEGNAHS